VEQLFYKEIVTANV